MLTLRRFFIGLGALIFVAQLVWLPRQVRMEDATDADVYRRAAERLAAGQPVYGGWPREQLDHPPGAFLYPPTALMLFKPFATAGRTASRTWIYSLTFVAFWMFAAALGKIWTKRCTVVDSLAAGGVLMLVPGTAQVMILGNADLIVWALVAWAFAAPRVAGWLLVGASALKLFPAVLIVVWAWRASTRFLRQVCLAGLLVLASTLLVVGGRVFAEWFTVGLPALREGVLPVGNFSISAQLVRLFVHDMTAPLPRAAVVFLAVFPYAVIAATAWLTRRLPLAKYGAIALVVAVWVAPICWWWRLTPALTLAVAVWIRQRREPHPFEFV